MFWFLALASLYFSMWPEIGSAYVGPGLGAGIIASVLGTIIGLLMLVVGAIWYPLKRIWRYLRQKTE
jgi:hypothetical protein